jgi:hypothetical protein
VKQNIHVTPKPHVPSVRRQKLVVPTKNINDPCPHLVQSENVPLGQLRPMLSDKAGNVFDEQRAIQCQVVHTSFLNYTSIIELDPIAGMQTLQILSALANVFPESWYD